MRQIKNERLQRKNYTIILLYNKLITKQSIICSQTLSLRRETYYVMYLLDLLENNFILY